MFKNISKKRLTVLLVSLLSVIALSVGLTLAYVYTKTDDVKNEFEPSKVSCAVMENGETAEHEEDRLSVSTKSSVQIKNTGDAEAYIRVAVVVNWKKADGTVWAQMPAADDYSITFASNTGWTEGDDGYYYYKKPLAAGQTSSLLIKEVAFAPEMDNPYQECTVTVTVKAYAVQTANNTPASGNVLEVKGWPADLT